MGEACIKSKALPAGIPCKEIVLLCYLALTMSNFQIREDDSAGVYNADAARFWQANTHRIPLTREPFLDASAGKKES